MLLALLSLFWGLAWPAMKIVLSEIRPWTFRAICLAAGGAGLLALARAGGASLRVPAGDLRPLVITSLINITGWHILSAYGLTLLHAGRAAIIAYSMPLWAILLSRLLLKERITSTRWWALAIGSTGLALLLGPDMQAVGAAPLGALMMLGAAVCWAAGTVLVKFFKWHMPGTLVMGWQLLIGGIPIIVGAILIDPGTTIAAVSWKAIAALIFVVALPTIFCHWAFFMVVQIFPANVAALSTLGIPVIGVFSSALILGEPVTATELIALFLVVLSLGLTSLGGRRTGRS
ncbi:MAG TPA: DMT family transporter [Desulfobacterales bacterium]|nr:DMT family transporter [Desulfobacterales bacterium]